MGEWSALHAQSIDFVGDTRDTFISQSGCEAGGEIWACGSSQLAQAHDDFKNNCSGWDYQCGKTLKTILDVCAPQIVESKITSENC